MKNIADIIFVLCGIIFMNMWPALIIWGWSDPNSSIYQENMSILAKWIVGTIIIVLYNGVWLFISYIAAIDGEGEV